MILRSLCKAAGELLRKVYLPSLPPLLRQDVKSAETLSLGWRFLVSWFFLQPTLPSTEPLPDRVFVFVFLQAPILALFWLPYIIFVCRRLQGIGVGIPYLGWFFLLFLVAFFVFLGDYRPLFFGSRGYWILLLVLPPFYLPSLWKDNPVYGVGVFSRHGVGANRQVEGRDPSR